MQFSLEDISTFSLTLNEDKLIEKIYIKTRFF